MDFGWFTDRGWFGTGRVAMTAIGFGEIFLSANTISHAVGFLFPSSYFLVNTLGTTSRVVRAPGTRYNAKPLL